MSFIEHLEELRGRLIKMVGAVALLSILGWFLEPHILRALEAPLVTALQKHHNIVHKLVTFKIYGAFTLQLKLAVMTGLVLAIPILVQQTWGFVVPALPAKFYRYGPYVMIVGVVLFVAGGLTGYEVMPLAINFFVGQGAGLISILPDASSYISFVSLIIVVFGISYELPLVLVMLCLAGITNSSWLWRKRVMAFFIIFAGAMVITPGADWISPLVLGGILYVLFLASIVVAKALKH